jgi:hypothetical protein
MPRTGISTPFNTDRATDIGYVSDRPEERPIEPPLQCPVSGHLDPRLLGPEWARSGCWCGLLLEVEEPRVSDFGAFGQSKRVLYVDAEIPDRALDLRMAEQDLNREGFRSACI